MPGVLICHCLDLMSGCRSSVRRILNIQLAFGLLKSHLLRLFPTYGDFDEDDKAERAHDWTWREIRDRPRPALKHSGVKLILCDSNH